MCSMLSFALPWVFSLCLYARAAGERAAFPSRPANAIMPSVMNHSLLIGKDVLTHTKNNYSLLALEHRVSAAPSVQISREKTELSETQIEKVFAKPAPNWMVGGRCKAPAAFNLQYGDPCDVTSLSLAEKFLFNKNGEPKKVLNFHLAWQAWRPPDGGHWSLVMHAPPVWLCAHRHLPPTGNYNARTAGCNQATLAIFHTWHEAVEVCTFKAFHIRTRNVGISKAFAAKPRVTLQRVQEAVVTLMNSYDKAFDMLATNRNCRTFVYELLEKLGQTGYGSLYDYAETSDKASGILDLLGRGEDTDEEQDWEEDYDEGQEVNEEVNEEVAEQTWSPRGLGAERISELIRQHPFYKAARHISSGLGHQSWSIEN